MKLAEGLVIAERYSLVKPLGTGGSGKVWLVHDQLTDVDMALKFCDSVDDFGMKIGRAHV